MAGARSYRDGDAGVRGDGRDLDTWYARLEIERYPRALGPGGEREEARQAGRKNVAKARTKDSLKAFDKLTRVVDGQPRIIGDPPLIIPIEDLLPPEAADELDEKAPAIVRSYRRTLPRDRRKLLERFRYDHAARKVVGVGSVGTRAWIVLLLGRDEGDPLFLQFKEAQTSVLEPFLGKSEYANHGQRVVEGQRLMQAASDIMLGWDPRRGDSTDVERDFYIRQLWDAKGSADVEVMEPEELEIYAELCGWTLARAHARSGDAIAIAAYLGTSDAFDRGDGRLRGGVRRPERARLRRAQGSGDRRARRRRDGRVEPKGRYLRAEQRPSRPHRRRSGPPTRAAPTPRLDRSLGMSVGQLSAPIWSSAARASIASRVVTPSLR